MLATYVNPWRCVFLSAGDDVAHTNENTAIPIDVLGNDLGSGLRLQNIMGGAAHIGDVITQIRTPYGLVQLKLAANNEVMFDPGTQFNSLQAGQSVSFQGTYSIGEGSGALASARINITVDGQNDRPSFTIRNRNTPFIEA